jgi:hypothetical protein
MKRREFMALLGGAAGWPLAARAQQSAVPVVGFVSGRSAEDSVPHGAAFRIGSFASDRLAAGLRGMSAVPPIATGCIALRRTTQRAKSALSASTVK